MDCRVRPGNDNGELETPASVARMERSEIRDHGSGRRTVVPATSYRKLTPVCYIKLMTKDQMKSILDRVLTWPQDRQQDAAEMLTLMEEQDKATLRLTDEQVAEVKRRLADPNPKFLTLDEVRERFARRDI